MNVVITNGWHDDNKGDCGIVLSMIESLRSRAKSFTIISEFSVKDYRYKKAYRHILEEYPDVNIIGSSWPIYPILKFNNIFLSVCKIDKILGKLLKKQRIQKLRQLIFQSMETLSSISTDPSVSSDTFADEFNEMYTVLKNADVVISKGGSFIFSDYTTQGALRLARVLYPLYIAKVLKKKVVFFPQSFGKIHGELSKSIAQPLLRNSVVFVREKLSGDYLKQEFDVDSEFLPDVACYLSSKVDVSNPFITKLDNLLKTGNILIGLTVRDWVFASGRNAYIKSIINIIKEVAKRHSNAMFVFVPQVTGPVCFEDDTIMMNRIVTMADSSLKEKILISKVDYSPYILKMIYKRMNVLIGTRLHSLIFAFTVGVPGIAIAYSENKTHGFYKELGCEDLVFNIDRLPILECVERVCFLINNPVQVMAKFNKMLHKYKLQSDDKLCGTCTSTSQEGIQCLNKADFAWIKNILLEIGTLRQFFY